MPLTAHSIWQNRLRTRTSFRRDSSPARGGWSIQDAFGRLHLSSIFTGDANYSRSDFSVPLPSWAIVATVTSFGDCTGARMEIDPFLGRIHLMIDRLTAGTPSVYIAYSDDDGATWTTPALYMANALFGFPWKDSLGGFGHSWFEYNSGTSGPGKQKARYRGPGDTSEGTTFTFLDSSSTAISVADGGWSNVVEASDQQGRLTWCPIINGETSPSVWFSTDCALTWLRI